MGARGAPGGGVVEGPGRGGGGGGEWGGGGRRTLRAWLVDSADAGLDEAGMVALFSSTLRDFHERRDHTDPDAALTQFDEIAGGAA